MGERNVDAVVDFLLRPRVGRRRYWTSLPVLGLVGVGGWLLFQGAHGLGAGPALGAAGIAVTLAAIGLALWVVGRRMKDTGHVVLWLLAGSLGGRLARAGVLMAGGSHDQADAALGLVLVLVLLGLGLAPSQRARVADEGEEDQALGSP
jgi:hypothetical protein